MNELIKIEVRNGQQLASGRELHKFLEVGTRYNDWINRIIEKYNFIENKDFITITQKRVTAQGNETEFDDHLMTIAMAKEIAMVANTEKGKEARIYFIKCEEAWNSPEMILARANQIQSHMIEDYTKKIELLENKVKEDKPKVLFADSVATSKTSILVGDLAKIIKQNGVDIGQKRLFTWLRDNGFLIKRLGTDYNMPTQKSMELELFEIKETAVTHADGHTTINKTPKVTGKGQIYFINKFKEA
ncbi:phage antirepressor KilAC domain-containing protein [Fusobacterium hwasookii]|uniref:phage antirepressor KilAC domain-containing protein n=1 Tax=Fusobacterium hwasookii TaxID=1583098 RepID=UPI0028E8EAFE|nr:phage antirepressor KilAC domain-containing protein [Fusobacterium hwasookii]